MLKLNPANVEGLILAGGLAAELARLQLGARRCRDAERELSRVVDEPAATDLPRWTMSERPRARALLLRALKSWEVDPFDPTHDDQTT